MHEKLQIVCLGHFQKEGRHGPPLVLGSPTVQLPRKVFFQI